MERHWKFPFARGQALDSWLGPFVNDFPTFLQWLSNDFPHYFLKIHKIRLCAFPYFSILLYEFIIFLI